ncbi:MULTISPECIES: hypothetical protein [Paenibacillus]|uniref:Uncharacterized protein n=1 Tax=Paenibacillus pabuli TaxID=1472 RepID=A0A855XWX4_9BACL|nr:MULTISPECIES: hypothetical protein [Paenibacillus]PWW42214.1 hypothetical protein DET56_104271 [Paenibacillus pabuli]PXW07602.1 hypothetical protein DEU73_105270 [Paenibacillus taichungensis]RAI94635.1 hypothetical protein DET54_107172 [Paenibacillus pabuli]
MKSIKLAANFLLTSVLAFSLSVPALAQQSEIENTDVSKGVFLPINTFNDLYGKPTSHTDDIPIVGGDASIQIQSIKLTGSELSLSATVNYNNQTKALDATGELYNSYKQQDSINSVVGDLKDSNGNFDIKLFDVYNDTFKDKMIVDQSLQNKPHLKAYLTDHQENILLFEIPLPDDLEYISVNNIEEIDTNKDFFWFTGVITPYEQKEIPTDEKIKAELGVSSIGLKAVGSFSDWTHSTTYYKSFYIGSDYIQAYSLPYGSWKALDVKNQSTWTNSFKIAEHVTVNGTTNRSVDSPFKYRNVKLSTGVGAKSTIITAYIDGKLSGASNGSSLAMKIAEKAWSTALPVAPSISDIKGWVDAIIDAGTSKTITLGSSNIKLSTSPTVVESANSGSNELFKYTDVNGTNTGHHLDLQTVVQYESSSGTSATANGLLKIKWDVYYASALLDSNQKEVSFQYSVSK